MNEMVRPEMMRDMMPKPEGEKPRDDADRERISGTFAKAEAPKPDAKAEAAAKAQAESDLEKAFFARGEQMNAAHSVGDILPKNAAEMAGEANQETEAMRKEVAQLKSEIFPLQ